MNGGGPGFEVDADRLGAHAAEFEGLAERATRIAADLRAGLEAGPTPWGTDAVGQSFAGAHEGPSSEVLRTLGELAGGLGDMGTRLSSAAGAYRSADTDAAGDLSDAGSAG
ncbi:hypothetical protein DI005_18495 [Prauserella sp. PE36]|uniref:WXG100 family type VII secretion target n=1 Tax=Prauserella endophytica TaxID=1592324 RepID=A0ABY2RXA7_9PSEU|nr:MULTISPECIES: hypothetical protein [Prauserella]PXY19807.1 hypothetical protein BAY59_32565 [Prauserella coralliicola]RBM18462.1 hypothetical protein DI005_18495 [Prauserella sp. PE36]TKG64261.1 hypothetical protein FCN18_29050 [Prauserella endophytica]